MRRAVRAEWVKAWSEPGTVRLLGALVAASAAVSAVTIAAARCPAAACGQDPARISLAGVYLAQAVAALAGVAAIGGEYGTGMIRVTLAAVPRRGRLLAAKALVLAGQVLAASAVAAGVSMAAGLLLLPGRGFTPAHGFDLISGGMWRAAGCAALYLALVALLGLGVTAAVRDAAAAAGTVLGLLYLFPVAAGLAGPGPAAAPGAGRPDGRGPGQPGHRRLGRPAAHPVAGPRGGRPVGRRRPARRDAVLRRRDA